jgi:heme/copper-type cytochrome/quinol oxidase subunit 2
MIPSPLKSAAVLLALLVSSCTSTPAIPLDAVSVRVVAQRVTWRASYFLPRPVGPAPGAVEGQFVEVETGREIHVPIGAQVTIAVTSGEFVAELTMPQLGVHDFAAPGLPTEVHFRASRGGRYDISGGEMCGLPHDERSRGVLVVEDARAYRAWIREHARG